MFQEFRETRKDFLVKTKYTWTPKASYVRETKKKNVNKHLEQHKRGSNYGQDSAVH